jgi:hypothetical protein
LCTGAVPARKSTEVTILSHGNRIVDLFPIRPHKYLKSLASSADNQSARKGLIRVGIIAFLTCGILDVLKAITDFLFAFNYLRSVTSITFGASSVPVKIVTALITPVQISNSTAGMTFIANNTTSFLLVYTLAGLLYVVLVIAIPALYVCFRKYSPAAIILGCVVSLVSLGALAISTGTLFSLITVSTNFAAATTNFQRAAYVAAYEGMLSGSVINTDAFSVILGLAFLVISVVMLRSPIRKWVGIFGIAISIFGIFATIVDFLTTDLDLVQISTILFAIWFFALANNLRRFVQADLE